MQVRVLGSSAITALAIALFAFATPARAQTASATVCADGTTASGGGRDICVGHGGVKARATTSMHSHATCNDGTVTEGGSDACKDHGGVKSTSSTTRTSTMSKTRADDNDSTHAIALCKNGMYSHAGTRRGACASNGGVERYLKRRASR